MAVKQKKLHLKKKTNKDISPSVTSPKHVKASFRDWSSVPYERPEKIKINKTA